MTNNKLPIRVVCATRLPRDKFLALLQRIAKRAGANFDEAVNDAIPLQYVVLAKPKI